MFIKIICGLGVFPNAPDIIADIIKSSETSYFKSQKRSVINRNRKFKLIATQNGDWRNSGNFKFRGCKIKLFTQINLDFCLSLRIGNNHTVLFAEYYTIVIFRFQDVRSWYLNDELCPIIIILLKWNKIYH